MNWDAAYKRLSEHERELATRAAISRVLADIKALAEFGEAVATNPEWLDKHIRRLLQRLEHAHSVIRSLLIEPITVDESESCEVGG